MRTRRLSSKNSRDLEELFLGITDGKYTGGRLENYTAEGTDLDELSAHIDTVLREFEAMISSAGTAGSGNGHVTDKDIFDCMLMLEDTYDRLSTLL